MSEKRDNSGAMFKAKAKPNDNPNWPQYDGSALIDGREYWLSAWVKDGKSGKFFSLSFKPKGAAVLTNDPPKPRVVNIDDDLPF